MQRDGSISIIQRWINRLRCLSITIYFKRICSVAKDGSKKINEVFKWTVEDSTDLNYGLRVLEGWMKQLKSYDWEIFKGKGAFDLDKAIKDVENLLKK